MQNMFFFQSGKFSYKKLNKLMAYIYDVFYAAWNEDEDEFRSLVKHGDSIIKNEVFKPFLNEVVNRRVCCGFYNFCQRIAYMRAFLDGYSRSNGL